MADEKYLFNDFQAYKDLIEQNKELNEKAHEHPELYHKYRENIKKRKTKINYLETNRLFDVKSDKSVSYFKNKLLRWPLSYKHHKTKIIIHHTADAFSAYPDQESVKKYIRGVYYFHAIKRAWWDIWYNFIIDQFWNIYEWRLGWEDVIWAHAVWNNVSSVWISLIWNFNEENPTQEQFNSLILLSTALAKKYNIDPYQKYTYHKEIKTAPYIADVQNFAIAWHKDAWNTTCPWTNLYNLLPSLRTAVHNNLELMENSKTQTIRLKNKLSLTNKMVLQVEWADFQSCQTAFEWFDLTCSSDKIYLTRKTFDKIWDKTILAKWKDKDYKIIFKPIWMDDVRELLAYKLQNASKSIVKKIKKIAYKTPKSDIINLIKHEVKVLLYEISNLPEYRISCTNSCTLKTEIKTFKNLKNIKILNKSNFRVVLKNATFDANEIEIFDDKHELVKIENFARKSYAQIPWNTFSWTLLFQKDYYKAIDKKPIKKNVTINKLSFDDYLAWIAESNDQMPFEKSKIMALLAKTYMLFYMNKQNIHPSIPKSATYNAIDDPRIFQKYVGAGRSKTSKTWSKALSATKEDFLIYNNYIPILPYFSCSLWHTFSALQKFWRTDTPYLTNNIDLWKCENSAWHGVWLSWKGAEYLAKKWLNYKTILQWYYPWVELVKIK